tara:strand:- start:1460 stop:3034 length:1575 start_codon:yes stop_codon:yes gene_type:complete
MAQQLQNITVQAPGFAGINSQDSPISLDQSFAATASNCIIDEYGRIGARKGYTEVSTDSSTATQLGSSRGIEAVHEYVKRDGTKTVFSAGNLKIFTGTTTLTPVTLPDPYTITANNWKIITFNNDVYFFQRGHKALKSTAGSTTLVEVVDGSHYAPEANEVIGGFGKLWAADVSGNKHTVYWSDTLVGINWHGGTSGSLDLTNVFPSGDDEVVALSVFNNFLVIFCKRSIIIYSGADNTTTTDFKLHDTVEGVGCIARDSVQHTGTDIIFLSEDGVRSFGRTIQEKSMPMRDISNNVRNELTALVRVQTNPIKSIYSADEAFYLLSLQDSQTIYCFDMRGPLPDGANRVTTWSSINPRSMALLQDGSVYFGRADGIFKYEGHKDNGSSYLMTYYSNPLNFGNSTNLKFLKKFNITVIGNVASNTTLAWGYDYGGGFIKKSFNTELSDTSVSEYGTAMFGRKADLTVAEPTYQESFYTTGIDIQRPSVNTSGSGTVVTIGIESTINGAPYSIQQIDVHALLGRLI